VTLLGDLISSDYLKSQRIMHANPRGYGGRGYVWTSTVLQVSDRYKATSILDYGCGQGTLMHAIRLVSPNTSCREYDPAIAGKDSRPEFADMVVCTDVLEHIEPDHLDAVLAHIRGLARKVVFFVVATRPANKILPNGDNAHLIIEEDVWWQARIEAAGFTVKEPPTVHPDKMPGKCWIGVCEP
jgi:hypothetical protein